MNNYEYIDPDYKYTEPQTKILRNLAGIADKDALLFFESASVAKRANELEAKPIKIKNLQSLLEIHKYLFQDVYEWAGKTRTVEISKGGKQFFQISRFAQAFESIDNLILQYREIDKNDKKEISKKLAEILDNINFLHPFREGNGRTRREFVRTLALEKNLILNSNPADNADVYERYMSGTIDGDIPKLTNLIGQTGKISTLSFVREIMD